MCGVAAIHAYHGAAPDVDREELERMLAAMAARGPDGAGVHLAACGRVALGHRRLALVDPTPSGHQPMVGAAGQVVLALNGEIYNHRELRAELERDGARFAGSSDTEVVLRLYEARGIALVAALRGMFALVIFDARRRELFLARDAYGVKPLYFADDGWCVRAASQVGALLAGGRVSRERDPAALVGFLLTGSVPEPFTTHRDVHAVPAGTVVRCDALGARAPQTFEDVREVLRVAAEQQPAADQRRAADLARAQAALHDSVRLSRVADARVGVFLSGGVDSALVLRHAAAAGGDLHALTLDFEDAGAAARDEAACAARTAAACGAAHERHVITRQDFARDLPSILQHMDQPTIDGVNVWFASRAARAQGWKSALSGIGGDELFGGYSSFRDLPRWTRACAIPGRIPGLGALLRRASTRALAGVAPPKAPGMLEYARTWPGAWLLRRGLFMPWELPALIGAERARAGLERLGLLRHIGRVLSPMPKTGFARVAVLESCLYLRNQLLRDADWASMAHSIEVRVPLADCTLARAALPHLVRDGDDKARLHASAPVPAAAQAASRVKRGFHVPLERWVQDVPALSAWRRLPALHGTRVGYARRWAFVVADAKGLL